MDGKIIVKEGISMIGRKLIAALISGLLMIAMYSIFIGIDIGVFFGMYLMPIIFIYGIPSSMLSDYATKSLMGTKRIIVALFIHLFLAATFVPIPMLISGYKIDTRFSEATGLFDVFLFIHALIAAFLFWLTDELMKNKSCQIKRRKCLKWVGDLKI
ncbi:hypothetical protein K7887_03020 [Sutcliffiella horikoshii]|uniref:hypothetical protein n=1 Tax=Sutcliffiella horikoshii TaxID=79883 RepID=UPI001CBE1D3A|nr:hypothetical protein [Sutcliffiella horikoshii]UAL47957.1 hypothetical protein K7887_03020 [Sutcliffiella horikoshii]